MVTDNLQSGMVRLVHQAMASKEEKKNKMQMHLNTLLSLFKCGWWSTEQVQTEDHLEIAHFKRDVKEEDFVNSQFQIKWKTKNWNKCCLTAVSRAHKMPLPFTFSIGLCAQ